MFEGYTPGRIISKESAPQRFVRFFVVRDIGHSGDGRAAVADATAKLQHKWVKENSACMFVLATTYMAAVTWTTSRSKLLEEEMMYKKLLLPWFFCKGTKWQWHHSRSGPAGGAPAPGATPRWSWNALRQCSLSRPHHHLDGLCDINVIKLLTQPS
jgi:hypothetical protein